MVLVGPSGSGKTTALRMLAGLEEVDMGSIFIGDRDITDLAPKNRDIAMVFQNYALYPYLTVAANIAFPLRIAKVKRRSGSVASPQLRRRSASPSTWIASPASCPAGSDSASRWDGRSSASRACI